MSAELFTSYVNIIDPNEAFNSAVEEAQYAHGHAGYTGTIAEKTDFVVKSQKPMTDSEIEAKIDATHDDTDKWGPAFALPMADEQNKTKIAGWVFYGCASN